MMLESKAGTITHTKLNIYPIELPLFTNTPALRIIAFNGRPGVEHLPNEAQPVITASPSAQLVVELRLQ